MKAETLEAIDRILRWYVRSMYGRHEGPGSAPFYCDSSQVGHFAVRPAALARGEPAALFRLFVVLAMYQGRRDVDIMRRQRGTSKRDVASVASADTISRRIRLVRCEVLRRPGHFEDDCSVRREFPSGRATCDRPRTACHVKDATRAIGRMGDFGKLPTSAWLKFGSGGGLRAVFQEVCRIEVSPARRAAVLVERLTGVHRVGRKLATMFVGAISTPELAPGLTPWAPAVLGSGLVVVDANLRAAVDRLHPGMSPRTYSAYEAFVQDAAARLDLRTYRAELPSWSPRLIQQALYCYRSRSNRAARGDPCAELGECEGCVPTVCPFGPRRLGRQVPPRG